MLCQDRHVQCLPDIMTSSKAVCWDSHSSCSWVVFYIFTTTFSLPGSLAAFRTRGGTKHLPFTSASRPWNTGQRQNHLEHSVSVSVNACSSPCE